MRRALILSALLVATLFVGPGAGLVSAQEAGNSSSEFTAEELSRDGTHQSNSPPGVRMGDETAYWAVYWPSSRPFANVGDPDTGEYLGSGTTVGRNVVHLRTWAFDDRQKTVHVVYWERKTREVRRGNATERETYAANVTHVTHDVTFDRGRPSVPISLQKHDRQVQVTMWIEGHDWARWRFQHNSLATSQQMSIDSVGEYLSNVIVDFLLLIVVGLFGGGMMVKRGIEEAGVGPQYGYAPWVAGLTILTGAIAMFAYDSLANLVANAPFLLAGYVVLLGIIVMLETYEINVSKSLFLQPTLEYAESPSGEDAYDVVDMDAEEARIVRPPNGGVAVVTPGIRAFLARVFGATADLSSIEQMETRIPMPESAEWDEAYIADPEADEILEYEQEGWAFELPPVGRDTAPRYALAMLGIGLSVASFYAGAPGTWIWMGVTAVGIGAWALTPDEGDAHVEPAPIHLRQAFGTIQKLAAEVDDAKHFDAVKEQLKSERVRAQREVDDEVAAHDSTLVQEMMDPDGNVPASLTDGDEADLEVEPREKDPLANGEGDDD